MATPGEGLERVPPTEGEVSYRIIYTQGVVSHPQWGQTLTVSRGNVPTEGTIPSHRVGESPTHRAGCPA